MSSILIIAAVVFFFGVYKTIQLHIRYKRNREILQFLGTQLGVRRRPWESDSEFRKRIIREIDTWN